MTLTTCPRCGETVTPGGRNCTRCGFDVSWDQGAVTTAQIPSGSFPSPVSPIDLLRHATLGEYEIISELGRGGMATVYLAHDITLNRKVAIKVLSPGLVHGPGLVERFKREARTAGALSHPHIIPIHAVRESDQILYFVMKYVPGRPLDSVLAEVGPFSIPMARLILVEAARALDYAHRQGVIHRDVKPGNIMVDEEGFAVITDFGIAKAEGEGLTQTGTVVGTPAYVSPEICLGQAASAASDQYSLGVVGFQLLTGVLPFQADSHMALMYAQIHTTPPPLESLREDCPPELAAAVMRMLAKSAAERWPSLGDAAAAIAASAPPDDSVRGQIGGLARNRADRRLLEEYVTPRTPITMGRYTPGGSVRLASGETGRIEAGPAAMTGRTSRAARWLFLAAVAGVTGALVWYLGHPRAPGEPVMFPAPAAVTAAAAADSLWVSTRGAAEFARNRAAAAGAAPRELGSGDSLQQLAEAEAGDGKKAEAAVHLTQATGLWAAAEKAAVLRRVAPAAPSPASTPAAAPPSPPSDSEAILGFYRELEGAIEARQFGEVKRLLSNMTAAEEGRWRRLFDDQAVETIEAHFAVDQITVRADKVYAHLTYDLAVTKRGKTDARREEQHVVLTRGPQGWRQISAETDKSGPRAP